MTRFVWYLLLLAALSAGSRKLNSINLKKLGGYGKGLKGIYQNSMRASMDLIFRCSELIKGSFTY